MTIPEDIIDRAYKGTATKEDAFALLDANPFELYALADDLRKEAVGDTVTYVTNRNIYITNMLPVEDNFGILVPSGRFKLFGCVLFTIQSYSRTGNFRKLPGGWYQFHGTLHNPWQRHILVFKKVGNAIQAVQLLDAFSKGVRCCRNGQWSARIAYGDLIFNRQR